MVARPARRQRHSRRNVIVLPFFKVLLGLFCILSVLSIGIVWLVQPRTWSLATPETVVVVPATAEGFDGSIYVLRWYPAGKEAAVVALSPELPVTLMGGYGQYPLRSIWPLLAIDHKSPEYVRAVYSQALQLPVTQVWTTSDRALLNSLHRESRQANLRGLAFAALRGQVATPLSLVDRLQTWWWLGSIRNDQVSWAEAGDAATWEKSRRSLRTHLPNECAMTVLNTTSVARVGTTMASALENQGFTVLRVTDDKNSQATSQIFVDEAAFERCQPFYEVIQALFPHRVTPQRRPGIFQGYRANIAILVGEDAAQELVKSR